MCLVLCHLHCEFTDSNFSAVSQTGWNKTPGVKADFTAKNVVEALPFAANFKIIGNSDKVIAKETHDWTYGNVDNATYSNKPFRQTNAFARTQVSSSTAPSGKQVNLLKNVTVQQQSLLNNANTDFSTGISSLYQNTHHFRSLNPNEHVSRMGINALELFDTVLKPVDERNSAISTIGVITNPNWFPRLVERHIIPAVEQESVMYVIFGLVVFFCVLFWRVVVYFWSNFWKK